MKKQIYFYICRLSYFEFRMKITMSQNYMSLRTLSKLLTLCVLFLAGARLNAQTARLQFIHNSADPAFDTLDVYIDNQKLDDLMFRQASSLLFIGGGTHKLN